MHGGRIWGKEINTFFAFTIREKVVEWPDEGLLQTSQFPPFSVQTNPSPTICDGPPSPKTGECILSFSVYSFDKKYYLLKIQYFFREISWKTS